MAPVQIVTRRQPRLCARFNARRRHRPGPLGVRELFPGIRLRPLWKGANGATANVVEFDAGSRWEGKDVHATGPEEVYVVSGVFDDGFTDYPAGTFIHCPAQSWHIPQSRTGCVLFVFYPEG